MDLSHLISTHELRRLLDEGMTKGEREDLAEAEAICRRFLQWDLHQHQDGVSVKGRLRSILGRLEAEEEVGTF